MGLILAPPERKQAVLHMRVVLILLVWVFAF